MPRISQPTQDQLDEFNRLEATAKKLNAQSIIDSITALREKIDENTTSDKFEIWLKGLRRRIEMTGVAGIETVKSPHSDGLSGAEIDAHNLAIAQKRGGGGNFSLTKSGGRRSGIE